MLDFEHQFRDETDCLEYLQKFKWPNGYQCPKCRFSEYWNASGNVAVCRSCQHQTSLTADTIFHGTRKPLMFWFRAIWYVTEQKME